ncbi:hypothetical protein Zm00014a_044179 [Zea mays]|uniref:Uncharacterized protein n=1 Tax=Zea mays TaxID=4577 RepID=A0A3L6EBM8_MAIZE|nr:hypothetical protein Zm00014a_044179 [Zea mays]
MTSVTTTRTTKSFSTKQVREARLQTHWKPHIKVHARG